MHKHSQHQTLDTYLGLCTEVYDLSKPHPPEDAYGLYRDYAMRANGPILEPMCGTGRFLLPLLEEGFDVHGFDASDFMLQALHNKAKAKNLQPTVWKGFVEDLKRPEQYHLIFIPSGSFCLLSDREIAEQALHAFAAALAKEGTLLLEIITPVVDPSKLGVWEGSMWRHNDRKKILLSTFSSLDQNLLSTVCKYELVEDNIVTAMEVEDMKIRLYDEHDIVPMLKRAGFSSIQSMKAFDPNSKPEAGDEAIIYACKL